MKIISWKKFFNLDYLGRRGVREVVHKSSQPPLIDGSHATAGRASGVGIVTVHSLRSSVQNVRTRSLTIYAFITCVLVGGLYYGIRLDLSFVDTMYFLLTTISTVGYGDIVPKSHAQYWFSVFYIMITVGIVSGLFNIQREFVAMAQRIDEQMRIGKLGEAMRAVNLRFRQSLRPEKNSALNFASASFGRIEDSMSSTTEAIKKGVINLRNSLAPSFLDPTGLGGPAPSMEDSDSVLGNSAAEKQLATLQAMNLRNLAEELDDIFFVFLYDIFVIVLILFVGGGIMSAIEGIEYVYGVYWACVTMTTIGFGDIVPVTTGGKVYNIFFLFFSVLYVTTTMASIAQYPIIQLKRRNEMTVMSQFGSNISDKMLDSLLNHEIYGIIGSNTKDETFRSEDRDNSSPAAKASENVSSKIDMKPASAESSTPRPEGPAPPRNSIATGESSAAHRGGDATNASGESDARMDFKLSKAEFILILLNMMEKVPAKDIILVASVFDTLDRDIDGFLSRNDVELDRVIMRMRRTLIEEENLERLSESRGNRPNNSSASAGRTSLGRMLGVIRGTLGFNQDPSFEAPSAQRSSDVSHDTHSLSTPLNSSNPGESVPSSSNTQSHLNIELGGGRV